jgi:hypothetical protein
MQILQVNLTDLKAEKEESEKTIHDARIVNDIQNYLQSNLQYMIKPLNEENKKIEEFQNNLRTLLIPKIEFNDMKDGTITIEDNKQFDRLNSVVKNKIT